MDFDEETTIEEIREQFLNALDFIDLKLEKKIFIFPRKFEKCVIAIDLQDITKFN